MKQLYKKGDKAQKYQGDVSILTIPETYIANLKFKPLGHLGYTVAVGETTGNKHTVVAEDQAVVEMAEDENGVFIRVLRGAASVTGHREHEPYVKELVPLAGKVFYVGRMYSYDPLGKDRLVQD